MCKNIGVELKGNQMWMKSMVDLHQMKYTLEREGKSRGRAGPREGRGKTTFTTGKITF